MTALNRLTDEELLRHAYIELDDLTATDIYREVLTRFEANADKIATLTKAADVLENAGVDVEKTTDIERIERALAFDQQHGCAVAEKLIDACADEDVYDADDFKRLVERAKAHAIRLEDAGLPTD